ncbi:MAG: hypothetical protein ACREEZ_05235 [Stellaceae bacterium]
MDLEALPPAEHRARLVWRFVETLDLTGFYQAIGAPDRRDDQGLARPLVDEAARHCGRAPRQALPDQGCASRADIAALAEHRLGAARVYAPPPGEKPETAPDAAGRAPHPGNSAEPPDPPYAPWLQSQPRSR